MAIDLSQLTDYTWPEIKLAAKHAMVQAAVGGAQLSIGGRSLGRITIEEATKLYNFAERMIADEGGNGGGIALIRYGDRV